MKLVQLSFFLCLLLSLPVLYNNCGAIHEGVGANSSASVREKMVDQFQVGFRPFLQTNCGACHVPGGVGSGKFAGSNIEEAYSDFYDIGYQKIAEYAVNNGHNYPYTGSQNQEQISKILEEWETALLRAYADSGSQPEERRELQVFTNSKIISLADVDSNRVIRWVVPQNIETSSASLSGMNDVTLEIQVNLIEVDENIVGYAISRPKLTVPAGNSIGVRISGVESFINDQQISSNTFSHASICVKPGESIYLSNSGSTTVDMYPQPSDRISIATYGLALEECLSPADFPSVDFTLASANLNEGSPGANYGNSSYPFVDVVVRLSEPAIVDSRVKLQVLGSSTANKRALGNINRFDWDFDFDDTELVFFKGDQQKTVRINISDDQRDEPVETMILGLRDPVNLKLGTTSNYTLSIVDDDNAPGNNEVTLSQIMSNLFLNSNLSGCIDCHNSRSSAGGLDVTDYKKMIRTGVVFPTDINNSALYQRTRGVGGSIMPPGSSGLTPNQDQMIRSWISSGAKNN